jgi:hypothetical protein
VKSKPGAIKSLSFAFSMLAAFLWPCFSSQKPYKTMSKPHFPPPQPAFELWLAFLVFVVCVLFACLADAPNLAGTLGVTP